MVNGCSCRRGDASKLSDRQGFRVCSRDGVGRTRLGALAADALSLVTSPRTAPTETLDGRRRLRPSSGPDGCTQVLAGGYRLRTTEWPVVTIVTVGVLVVEACAAADELATAGVSADVICLTSPDLIFRAQQARQSPDWPTSWPRRPARAPRAVCAGRDRRGRAPRRRSQRRRAR